MLISFLISGCSKVFAPTYPKETISEAIVQICQKEYNITEKIDVKIAGKTLGVRLHLPKFFRLAKKQQEKLFDEKIIPIFKVLRRVIFSTDAELEFFIIQVLDESMGAELQYYNYITDLRKFNAGWISPEEYQTKRLVKNLQLDTLKWGKTKILNLISDIEKRNMLKVLLGNFGEKFNIKLLSPEFLKILSDVGKKQFIKWHVLFENSIQFAPQKRLFYIEAKEYYIAKPDKIGTLSYPNGTIHKFYILISIKNLVPVIEAIYTEESLPSELRELGPPEKWKEDEYFVKDYTFPEFFSNQVIQGIMAEFIKPGKENSKKEEEETSPPPFTLDGQFIIEELPATHSHGYPKNVMKIIVKFKNTANVGELKDRIIEATLKSIKESCKNYKFYKIGRVLVESTDGTVLYSIEYPQLFKNFK